MANNSISRTGTFTSSGSAGGSGTYDYSGTSGYSGIDYYSNDDFKNESIFTDVSSKISIKFSEEIDNSSIKVFSKDTELPFDFQNKKGTVGLTHIVSATTSTSDYDNNLIYMYDVDGNNIKMAKWVSIPTATSAVDNDIVLETKDFDFGDPGRDTFIYKLIVQYTGGTGQDVTVKYRTNGSGA